VPPVRTCIATRRAADPGELIRLVPGPDGQVLVDYRARHGGRGAWVTPGRKEIELLVRKPRILARALRCQARTEGLLDRVREANRMAVVSGLTLAARSGALAGGKERVRAALSSGQGLALVLAADASERLVADLRGRCGELPVVEVPFTRDELGALIGKGPRAALVIKRGKPGLYLARELHRMQALR
jgi:predicted RNA-binding protein YlxR (DUF448 family)/ribosomal protein L30E